MTLRQAQGKPLGNYRADIDGLRAVAILAVVLFHAFPTVLPGGFVGVDIFFVISGFLISNILFNSLVQGGFSVAEFYAHRLRRIFPALLLVSAACFVFGWIELLPEEYAQLGKHMAGGIGFVVNFLLWGEAGYFDTASEWKPLMHLWSLAVEEQFYLLYPLAVVLAWGRRARVAVVIGSLALVSFMLGQRALEEDPVGAFFLPQNRFWELLAGGLLAFHLRKGRLGRVPPALAHALSLGGLMLLLGTMLGVDRSFAFPGWWALLPVGGTALLIAAGPRAVANRRLLARPAMRFVGVISYPLYLWHWPLLAFARIADAGEPSAVVRGGAVLTSLLLAWLTWRLVERPIRFGPPSRRKIVILCLTGALLGLVGYKTFDREGYRFRQKNFGQAEEALKWSEDTKFSDACRRKVGAPAPEYCLQSGEGEPRVALIGDSHANSLYPGLRAALAEKGEGLLHLGAPGCAPLLDTDLVRGQDRVDRDCMGMVNHLINSVASHPTVAIVALAMRGPRHMYGTGFGPVEASMKRKEIRWLGAPPGAGLAEMFGGALGATVERLLAAGKRVVIVADWPELGFDPRACLNLRPVQFARPEPGRCVVSLAAAQERNREFRALLASLQSRHPGLQVFDPWPLLCDELACQALQQTAPLYRDNNHLSVLGSSLIGGVLAAALPLGPRGER